MKTPKEYKTNLAKGIITEEMLGEALYSVNKRAKNYRDKAQEYRDWMHENRFYYDKYDNVGQCREKMEALYRIKSEILQTIEPIAIHRQETTTRRRIYDSEAEFSDLYFDAVHVGSYYDRSAGREVEFIDVPVPGKTLYFLYYAVGGRTFHSPITESQAKELKLPIEELEDDFETLGEDVKELLPLPFCRKIHSLYMSQHGKCA